MEPAVNVNSLIAIGVGVILAIIIFKVVKSIIKAVGIVLLVVIALYFWQGGTVEGLKDKAQNTKEDGINLWVNSYFKTKKVAIPDLVETFCVADKVDKAKCACVITPVYEDLTSRLSSSELAALEQNHSLKIREIRNSITNRNEFIKKCGVERKGQDFKKGMEWLFQKTGEVLAQ